MFLRISYLFFILYFLCPQAHGQQEFFPFLGEIASDGVNVRSGESTGFDRLCQMGKGDEVIVVDKSYSWYKIKLPGIAKSFVSDKYVRLLDNEYGEITGNRVNVRSRDSANSSVLTQLNSGTKVRVLEKKIGWYKISPVDDSYGWVSDEFLRFKSKDITLYNDKKPVAQQKNKDIKSAKKKKSLIKVIQPLAKEKKKASVTNPPFRQSPQFVSAIGYIEPQRNSGQRGAEYKLIINGKPTYYLDGLKYIFDEFLHYKISIEGVVNSDLQGKFSHPVVTVSKIQLVL